MPKGVPKNQKLVDEILYRLCAIEIREKVSRDSQDKLLLTLAEANTATRDFMYKQEERIASLERRIAEMNEAFSHARFPRAPQQSFSNNDQSQIPS